MIKTMSCDRVEEIIGEIGCKRIVEKHNPYWREELEDAHSNGEMAYAAIAYILGSTHQTIEISPNISIQNKIFPWDNAFFKPGATRREDLVNAANMIIAEIERYDRIEANKKREEEERVLESERQAAALAPPMPEPPFVLPAILHREMEQQQENLRESLDALTKAFDEQNNVVPIRQSTPPPMPNVIRKPRMVKRGREKTVVEKIRTTVSRSYYRSLYNMREIGASFG